MGGTRHPGGASRRVGALAQSSEGMGLVGRA